MRWIVLVAALGIGLGGCALQEPPVSTAVMPDVTGLADPVNAVQYAAWAFAAPRRTRNDPISAVKAVAALDFAAGNMSTSAAFAGFNPLVTHEMLTARTDVRHALGIAEDAPSQAVVNALTLTMLALQAGDRAAALTALSVPMFTLGPERTLDRLSNLPYIRMANVATSDANAEINTPNCRRCGGGM